MAAFLQFLAALREQHRVTLTRELGRYSTVRDDIAEAVRQEMVLEQAFARNAADRVASALPTILRIVDPREREAKLRQLLADEERFARQRGEAMFARAVAAVTRFELRRTSPLGAAWRLGHAHNHTDGCVFMAGGREAGSVRFWPWAVIDRVFPPRHYGCTSSLHGYGEAILNGWITPSDVPDTRAAVRAAAGVVMEQQEADAVLAELDIRELLQERGIDTSEIPFAGVVEAFDDGKHPRGYHGRFRKVADVAAALKRGEKASIEPKDAARLFDELADGKPSSLHLLEVRGHPNLFRAHARELSRGEMPQIPKEHLPGFMDFLRSKRVLASVEEVSPSKLQATQNQVNGAAVAALAKGWDPQKGGMMLVSRERHVLDGHHRWGAAAVHELANPSYKVQALRFSAGTDRMLALMREYNALQGVKARRFGEGRVPGEAA